MCKSYSRVWVFVEAGPNKDNGINPNPDLGDGR